MCDPLLKSLLLLVSIAQFLVASFSARAQSGGGGIKIYIVQERQQERRAARWTLQDWFDTKKTIARQNAWLAQHTNKLPLDIAYGFDLSKKRQGHELDLYLLRLGLRARYESNVSWFETPLTTDLTRRTGELSLQMRLFGGNLQDTNLILRGGYEYDHITTIGNLQGPYGGYGLGPELQIYFARWLGVRADWRYRFGNKHIGDQTLELSGNSYQAVGFLEMDALRFEGGYRSRSFEFKRASINLSSEDQSEVFGRLRLFF